MEFDKNKVYTALNADELKPGSKVFVADNLATLKEYVDSERSMATIRHIANDSQEHRFIVQFNSDPNTCAWGFAYLISEPEETWIVYLCRKDSSNPEDYYLTACISDKWESVKEEYGAKTKLFEDTEDKVEEWYTSRRHLADIIAAWEDGKSIQFEYDGHWLEASNPEWKTNTKYRIKPEGLKWTDLKVGDIVRRIDTDTGTDVEAMVVAIDKNPATNFHVMIGNDWTTDDCLANAWGKVE